MIGLKDRRTTRHHHNSFLQSNFHIYCRELSLPCPSKMTTDNDAETSLRGITEVNTGKPKIYLTSVNDIFSEDNFRASCSCMHLTMIRHQRLSRPPLTKASTTKVPWSTRQLHACSNYHAVMFFSQPPSLIFSPTEITAMCLVFYFLSERYKIPRTVNPSTGTKNNRC